jgi:hypothetical protein
MAVKRVHFYTKVLRLIRRNETIDRRVCQTDLAPDHSERMADNRLACLIRDRQAIGASHDQLVWYFRIFAQLPIARSVGPIYRLAKPGSPFPVA